MSCKSLLPTNLDPAVNALDIAGCERLKQIEEALKAIEDFHDAMKIDERFLDLLADSYEANRFKEFEPRERELILYAQRHYPKLGTVAAVKEVMRAFGLEAEVKEWFEYQGNPYYFRLLVRFQDGSFSEGEHNSLQRLIRFAKNIRSRCEGVILLTEYVEHFAPSCALLQQVVVQSNAEIELGAKTAVLVDISGVYRPKIKSKAKVAYEAKQTVVCGIAKSFNTRFSGDISLGYEVNIGINTCSLAAFEIGFIGDARIEMMNSLSLNIRGATTWQV